MTSRRYFSRWGSVRASLPLAALETLAARADVASISSKAEGVTNAGSVTSQGLISHQANVVINNINLGTVQLSFTGGGVTQLADPNGNVLVNFLQQNGSPAGTLQSIGVSDQGRVTGSYSNGRTIDLAVVTLASFAGENALKKLDGGTFEQTADSGTPLFNATGKVIGSSLEASNTDIADEFSKLIVTQQAYSANTKIITTGNQMVQDLLAVLR